MKECFICHETKPLTEYYRHPRMGDGYLGKCKDCTKRHTEERRKFLEQTDLTWVEKEAERHRQKSRRTREDVNYKPVDKPSKIYRGKYPKKYKAHSLVGSAVKYGRLTVEPCCICGGEAEAHHEDYSKPLDVIWFCKKHHMARHVEINNEKRRQKFLLNERQIPQTSLQTQN